LAKAVKGTTRSLTQAEYEALANLRYAIRRFTTFSKDAAQLVGLPPQQHQALLAIKGTPVGRPVTIGHLSERLLIAPHAATGLVGRLVDAGLVKRAEDPADRRRQIVSLTANAEAVLCELSIAHLAEIRSLAPVLMKLLETLEEPGRGDTGVRNG
jgi:DNA-binding MarR family transcriptional regulator